MTSRRASLRLVVPVGLASLVLAAAGTLTPASAATNWSYMNDYEGNCLASSTTTSNVWSATCNDSLSTRTWHWGATSYSLGGHTWRRLVSNANGDCLSTAFNSSALANPVWTSPCGRDVEQFWTGDGNRLQSADDTFLRTSGNGDAVYADYYSVVSSHGIEPERFVWWGAHD
ncbi:hypothetical protein [Streptomyces yerevanensis]|uniref:hypothetical protein n=1 Tax=Streptomyces yerevanensis TaxID=66378 RepID=UPI0005263C6E|nr:hypothetical protein [Streptomyces yerevanensis]